MPDTSPALLAATPDAPAQAARTRRLRLLRALERKVLWLSAWTIHHANHIRPNRDGLKVGGHQASCASLATIMTALYFAVLRPQDRVAVKPHASPVFHAIQYLFGQQSRERLERFRALGGAQSYPSRTKDSDDVDFSTGSVGLGVAMTLFSSLVQDYVRLKALAPERPVGRMVALVGDAELDEGNVFEALLEGWKHDVRNLWWVIDYNRQSLDSVVNDRLFGRVAEMFELVGWRVVTLKYGKTLEAAFAQPDGEHLRQWIDDCPNSLYSALVYKGGAAWREALTRDLNQHPGIRRVLETHDDARLHALMTNLAGLDMQAVLDAFESVTDDRPTCFIAYTIKGRDLPFAGHKDNHAGLMNVEQMAQWQQQMGVPAGAEWDRFAGLDADARELQAFIDTAPFHAQGTRRLAAPAVPVPASLPLPKDRRTSTQAGFGRILDEIAAAGGALAERIVTTSPDVTVSTNLGGWVNRKGLFAHTPAEDVFRELKVVSAQRWSLDPKGQHIELGIAENNLFIQLAALGLAHELFGARLLPIGTLYDPFIARGLDALNYACYQDARFIVAATPSGVTLAPEGGAHQSVSAPLIGIGQPGLLSYEPAYVDELSAILRFGLEHIQQPDGSALYLRLSTRPVEQPARALTADLARAVVEGGYWLREPAPGAEIAIVAMGAVTPDALAAWESVARDFAGAGLLVVTSADRLHRDWIASRRARRTASSRAAAGALSPVERLLAPLGRNARLITVLDGHPLALSWLGGVAQHRTVPLGVEGFGQSGDIPDLYRKLGLDSAAIIDAVAQAVTESW
ncbi:transketolase [Vineibacter terrae]|uniref:Pyruvate dehydrogenase E1 component n=1 Tax=Vineibacter terrae TaxID=2586908 RepID=A0A5C8PEC5_9HYPH|nr:transketolase [Vineibacter terrae]TXL71954.1 transketolase [Vineibacter terrae]